MSKSEDLVVGNIMEGGPFYVNKMIEVRLSREENPKHLLLIKNLLHASYVCILCSSTLSVRLSSHDAV